MLTQQGTSLKLQILLSTMLVLILAACNVQDSQISNFPIMEPAQTVEQVETSQRTETARMEATQEVLLNDREEAFVATTESEIPTEITIENLQMMDGENGWGMDTEKRLLFTKNGGDSWQDVTPELGEYEWNGFFALDMQHAWLVPTRGNCATETCSAYQIWRTTDGGSTWKAGQPLCTGNHCTAHNSTPVDFAKPIQVQFLDEANGWLLLNINHVVDLDHYRIYRTNDGGENWQFVIDHNDGPLTYQVTGLSFYSENSGWLTTSDLKDTGKASPNWFVYRSFDGGTSWKKYQVPELHSLPQDFLDYEYSCGIVDLDIRPLEMLDLKMNCIVYADEAEIAYTFHYHSLTEGKNWSRWQMMENTSFVNVISGWQTQLLDGEYVLEHTRDGGANWATITTLPWLGEVLFPNDSTGFSIVSEGEKAGFYRTLDGGENWNRVKTMLTQEPVYPLADDGIREFFLSGPNGQTFPVVYYPPSTSSAPVVILMHQVNMDLHQWDAIARWLWKEDVSEYQDEDLSWLNSSWFPENTLEEKPAVFVFTYRGCNNGCIKPDATKILNDAQTVINYAINQPEIDPARITVVGTSVSADAALDACFLMQRNNGFTCQNVVSLSPASYLDLEYISVVKEMKKTSTKIYCYASRADSESAVLCMENRPSDIYEYYVGKGKQHGVELFAPDYELNVLEKLIEIIGE